MTLAVTLTVLACADGGHTTIDRPASIVIGLVVTACHLFAVIKTTLSGRRGGLMVSALDSRSGGPGSSPGRGTALCSWARYFTLIVPLSTQVYKWVPANLLLGVTL